ncbi:toll-like receptor 13 [Diadema setosum]|uniref:toll-like receptor 13 n=1 Tax=Diadema setosum TaxID=31175 RepID=UPI003B3B3824
MVSLYQNAFNGVEDDTILPMKYFDISQNQLSCTCNLAWFRGFLSQGSLTLENPRTTVCSPQSLSQFVGKSVLEFYPDEVCGPNLSVYISASILILACIVGSVLAWRNRWWLNYKCFHLRLLIIGYYELEDARDHQDYRYDLNIIFPDEDEDWVLEEFLDAVQEHLPDFLRNRIVCGDDDLPLGSTRFDAMNNVIENSFKNLVIVSNASINDANYLMTLQMVVAHMNDVQLENVVMVFREDIPDNQLPYLVRLFLSKNKPYFQWTEERYQQMLFWEGLAKTLARNKKMNGLLPL